MNISLNELIGLYEAQKRVLPYFSDEDARNVLSKMHEQLDENEVVHHLVEFGVEAGWTAGPHPHKKYQSSIMLVTPRRVVLCSAVGALDRALSFVVGGGAEKYALSEVLFKDLVGVSGMRSATSFGLTRHVVLHHRDGRLLKIGGLDGDASKRAEEAIRKQLTMVNAPGENDVRARIESLFRQGNTELSGGSAGTIWADALEYLVEELNGEEPVHITAFQDFAHQGRPPVVLTVTERRLIVQASIDGEYRVFKYGLSDISRVEYPGMGLFGFGYIKFHVPSEGRILFEGPGKKMMKDLGDALSARTR